MIFLYSAVLLVLGAARFLVKRQAAALERKYSRAAAQTEELMRQPTVKEGNSSRPDPCQSAKRQYLLGQLVQKRDRVESRYTRWQERADRLDRWLKAVRGWKGRKLPYTCGVLDVAMALLLADWLGAGQYLNARALFDWARSWFVR
jgi:hypothetical protein